MPDGDGRRSGQPNRGRFAPRALAARVPRPAAPGATRPVQARLSGHGPTAVLLLHGQPGASSDWQWVTPLLSDRFQVVAADRPGYGRTGGPATGFAGNARAVIDLLDRLGLPDAIVVAHSWAGGVALAAAAGYPTRVRGLVLVSSVAPGEAMTWDDRLLARPFVGDAISAGVAGSLGLLLGSDRVRRFAERRLPGRARHAVVALAQLTGRSPGPNLALPNSAATPPGRDRPRLEPVWRSFVAEQRALLEELDGLGPGTAAIKAPTTILHGASDRLIHASVARDLQGQIRGSTLRMIPGAGHLLPHDYPVAISTAVDEVAQRAPRQ